MVCMSAMKHALLIFPTLWKGLALSAHIIVTNALLSSAYSAGMNY